MAQKQSRWLKSFRNPKNPALWIIIGYCVKGTAVTLGLLWAALFAI